MASENRSLPHESVRGASFVLEQLGTRKADATWHLRAPVPTVESLPSDHTTPSRQLKPSGLSCCRASSRAKPWRGAADGPHTICAKDIHIAVWYFFGVYTYTILYSPFERV